jgi:hypothetical protein
LAFPVSLNAVLIAPHDRLLARTMASGLDRLLKNAHLPRCPHPSSLQRTFKYASLLRISGALHLGIFDQPEKNEFFDSLLKCESASSPKLNSFLAEITSLFNLSETILTENICRLPLIS